MITLRNLTLRHGLRDFSGSFAPGTVSALIGGDGAGKTSLLRYLAGHSGLPAREVCYQPSSSGVWQNLAVRENLQFVADTYHLRIDAAHQRIEELLRAADLLDAQRVIGGRLSGGMRQKLGVCMAMLPQPKLLLLDEPTTGVDPHSREIMWRLIKRAAREGSTVIVATTYLDEAAESDQVFLLDKGELLAAGTPAEICAAAPGSLWQQPIDVDTVLSMDTNRVWRRGTTMYRWSPEEHAPAPAGMQPAEFDLDLTTVAMLLRNTPEAHTRVAKHAGFPAGEQLIQVAKASKRFGNFTALHQVSIEVRSGEIVGLIGSNGAGKSTLIRLILGLDRCNGGSVTLFGQPPSLRTRARLGYVPQSLGLYPTLSAQENLDFTTATFRTPKAVSQYNGTRLPVHTMPLGTQRNLAVECALSHEPQLLLLDEPTSGMDALSRAMLWKTLRHAAARGVGVLITTHYQQEALQCDRLIELEGGRRIQ